MFLKSPVRCTRISLAGAILLLAVPQAGLSQVVSSDVMTDEALDTLDEIVVYGEPTLRLLRDEVFRAEEKFYELFNALNEGKQFDVECSYRRPVGSQIARRVCEANFLHSPPNTYLAGENDPPYWAFVEHKTRQMQEEMAMLVDEHPELYAALLEFFDAKLVFESSVRDRCANRLAVCRP